MRITGIVLIKIVGLDSKNLLTFLKQLQQILVLLIDIKKLKYFLMKLLF
jgi:hypothetical protein